MNSYTTFEQRNFGDLDFKPKYVFTLKEVKTGFNFEPKVSSKILDRDFTNFTEAEPMYGTVSGMVSLSAVVTYITDILGNFSTLLL